jgi:hypothetical protein
MKAKDIVAGVWPPVGPIFDAVSLGIQTVAKLPLLLGQPQDRPFGHVQNADGTVSFNPKGLHFTYDHAETMLAQQPSGRGPGVFEMQFTNSGTPGDYTLYMLIERAPVVPSPPAPPPAAAVGNYVFLGGTLTSGPAVCSRRPGLLDVFARGTDNALRHMTYDQAWGRWEQLDPNPIAASTAAAVSWDAGRIDVFVRGTDDALYTKSLVENQWTGYVGLEGQLTSGPAACSWSAGRIDVFGRGTDEALWHRAYDRTWHPWERLGENKIADSNPAAVSWGPGRIDVFVRGTDSVLYTKSWVGSRWTDYVRLGGPGEGRIGSSPTVSSRGEGLLDVFACGTDGAMWHLRYDGGWNPWERLGTEVVSDPAAASWDSNRIDVFVRDVSGQLYTKSWDGTWL